jgi:hypothetical protein
LQAWDSLRKVLWLNILRNKRWYTRKFCHIRLQFSEWRGLHFLINNIHISFMEK